MEGLFLTKCVSIRAEIALSVVEHIMSKTGHIF